jgi:hypothetical protein
MLNKYISKTIQEASWRKAVLLTAVFATFFAMINYSAIGVAGLLRITGGANILDFEFGFSYDKALDMLTALGPDGRAFYLTRLLPKDFPFPVSYMLFFTSILALLLKHTAAAANASLRYALLIPVAAMLSDWIENVGIIAMLIGFPDLPRWAAALASISGMAKYVCTAGSALAIGALVITFVIALVAGRAAKSR